MIIYAEYFLKIFDMSDISLTKNTDKKTTVILSCILELDTTGKNIGAEIFGELLNVVLEENKKLKIVKKITNEEIY